MTMTPLTIILQKHPSERSYIEKSIVEVWEIMGMEHLAEQAAAELETLRAQLSKVRYCPDCESVVTPQGEAWNVFYCGRCDKNLLPPQVDTYKGETRGKEQEPSA